VDVATNVLTKSTKVCFVFYIVIGLVLDRLELNAVTVEQAHPLVDQEVLDVKLRHQFNDEHCLVSELDVFFVRLFTSLVSVKDIHEFVK